MFCRRPTHGIQTVVSYRLLERTKIMFFPLHILGMALATFGMMTGVGAAVFPGKKELAEHSQNIQFLESSGGSSGHHFCLYWDCEGWRPASPRISPADRLHSVFLCPDHPLAGNTAIPNPQ